MKRWLPLVLAAALAALATARPALAQDPTEAMLDTIQHRAFQYFWSEANSTTGLIRDRSQPGSPCSIAANGFGFSAICVGIDRGWVGRGPGGERVLQALQTFWNGPQSNAENGTIGYKGLFYHFLKMDTAVREWSSELSTIDTALLMAGILDAREYFNGAGPVETQIRALADSIYRRADWNWARNFNPGILMGWKPTGGFNGYGMWIGYNEAMILYLLALGSPTHAVPSTLPDSWAVWTSGYDWETHYGQTYVVFPPLFGHQYSHCWVDFRLAQDAYMRGKGITYFENSRRATLAQQAYCIANPGGFAGYSDSLWGITASDDPSGYSARGAPPAQNDNGTLVPTAPASSLPFAPEIVIPTLRNMYENWPLLWGAYGFRDAFNPGLAWYDSDFLGIDQGPIVLMIENYRTGSVWNRMMKSPYILTGLQRAGFQPTVDVEPPVAKPHLALEPPHPTPFRDVTTLRFRLPASGRVRLTVHDVGGREVARPVDGWLDAGEHDVQWSARDLASGLYYLRLAAGGEVTTTRTVRLR